MFFCRDSDAVLNEYQIAAQENRVARQRKGSLNNSAGLFSQFSASQTVEVSGEVDVGEDEIAVLDDTLPSPRNHSTPILPKKRKTGSEIQVATEKR